MSEPIQYPRARLDLYEEAVILTRYEGPGRSTSNPVAVDDLVAALSNVPVSSGLLPAGCLFWGRANGETRMAIYVPGRRWRLQTAERSYDIPLPPLVFAGAGVQQVAALAAHYAYQFLVRRELAQMATTFSLEPPLSRSVLLTQAAVSATRQSPAR